MKNDDTDRKLTQQLKFPILLFFLLGLLFTFANSQLGHMFDLAGLSGKKPHVAKQKPDGDRPPAGGRKPKQANNKPGEFSTQDPWRQPIEIVPAAKSPVIDGLIADWNMVRGIFMTPNYKDQANTSSVWFHFMYDEKRLYVLARCRGWDTYAEELGSGDELSRDFCLQIQIQGDAPLTFSYLGKQGEKEHLERRDFSKKGDSGVTDATAGGAKFATTLQPDAKGIDLEIAIPWKQISATGFKGNPVPRPGQRLPISVAARLGRKQMLGKVADSKFDARAMAQAQFLLKAPEQPLPIVLRKGKRFAASLRKGRVTINWDEPAPPQRTETPFLYVTPATGIKVDGDPSDWPLTAGMVASSELLRLPNGCFWLHAASDEKRLCLLAVVSDITPGIPGDDVRLRLKTDKVHDIQMVPGKITVDGKSSPDGVLLASKIRADGEGYLVEASLPWSSVGGKPSGPVPITCRVQLNPKWVFSDLISVRPEQYSFDDPATWGKTRPLAVPPASPVFALAGDVGVAVDVQEGKPVVQGREGVRPAFGTNHSDIRVLAGTAVIDGKGDEWDLRAGIYCCNDIRLWYGRIGAWFHTMYDEKGMYFLARIDDPTPLQKQRGARAAEDSVILRFASDSLLKITLSFDDKGQPVADVGRAEGLKKRLMKMKTPEEHGIQMAFAKRESGDGYTHEIFIPWTTLRIDGKPRKSGGVIKFTFEFSAGPGPNVIDVVKPAVKFRGITRDVLNWGDAKFLPADAEVSPTPCILRIGQQLPVRLEDGALKVDLSALK